MTRCKRQQEELFPCPSPLWPAIIFISDSDLPPLSVQSKSPLAQLRCVAANSTWLWLPTRSLLSATLDSIWRPPGPPLDDPVQSPSSYLQQLFKLVLPFSSCTKPGTVFFLEHAGELRIISLIGRKKSPNSCRIHSLG